MSLIEKIEGLLSEVKDFKAKAPEEVESFRIRILGSKGELKKLFGEFKNVPSEARKEFGEKLNELKTKAQDKINELKSSSDSAGQSDDFIDLTRPSQSAALGSRHPISVVRNRILDIFNRIGYTIAEGPEIEDDWHNFSALNFTEEHPARDMQDTFFIGPDALLRTHTSSVQVRVMESQEPPIRVICPGRVFRNEAISARAHCIFHQIEGLYIDKGVSFADMKQNLLHFARELFGEDVKIRLRPSYFPFTEPSAEMDIYWGLESEADYRITKGTGWLEIMGCGMIDPNVLKNSNIDPEQYSGFAFGMGIERIAMLLFQVKNLRLYFENDLRFLNQFKAAL
jgi:phenylalanyl-tRNA synthetase alpha chain